MLMVQNKYSQNVLCVYVTDIVSQDIAATLKVLYALFKKYKSKWARRDTQPPETWRVEDGSVGFCKFGYLFNGVWI